MGIDLFFFFASKLVTNKILTVPCFYQQAYLFINT